MIPNLVDNLVAPSKVALAARLGELLSESPYAPSEGGGDLGALAYAVSQLHSPEITVVSFPRYPSLSRIQVCCAECCDRPIGAGRRPSGPCTRHGSGGCYPCLTVQTMAATLGVPYL